MSRFQIAMHDRCGAALSSHPRFAPKLQDWSRQRPFQVACEGYRLRRTPSPIIRAVLVATSKSSKCWVIEARDGLGFGQPLLP